MVIFYSCSNTYSSILCCSGMLGLFAVIKWLPVEQQSSIGGHFGGNARDHSAFHALLVLTIPTGECKGVGGMGRAGMEPNWVAKVKGWDGEPMIWAGNVAMQQIRYPLVKASQLHFPPWTCTSYIQSWPRTKENHCRDGGFWLQS